MNHDARRLIEDYLPIEAICAEALRAKSVRKGHISMLHLWWARRPLVMCRAAVYDVLVLTTRIRSQEKPPKSRMAKLPALPSFWKRRTRRWRRLQSRP